MARTSVLACLAAILTACVQAPTDRLTATSREDPACAVELLAALEAFRDDLGLGYEVLEADADTLGEHGTLQKGYTRDAVRFTVEFGLDAGDDACTLRLWSMTEQRPGSTSTHTGDFGTVSLEICQCT
jgi:hypothetical protein